MTTEEKLKNNLLNSEQGNKEYYNALNNLKDFYLEQGRKEEKKKILVRVLDLLAYDWNNGSLVLLRDELKEKNE